MMALINVIRVCYAEMLGSINTPPPLEWEEAETAGAWRWSVRQAGTHKHMSERT